MPDAEHLKLIQGVITRLAGNCFQLKAWTVTLVAGLTALARSGSDRSFAWIAVAVAAVFGMLDAYYLALERGYRQLYASAVADKSDVWDLSPPTVTIVKVFRALFSVSVLPLHGVALVGAATVAVTT